jgi:hypothetical protein
MVEGMKSFPTECYAMMGRVHSVLGRDGPLVEANQALLVMRQPDS